MKTIEHRDVVWLGIAWAMAGCQVILPGVDDGGSDGGGVSDEGSFVDAAGFEDTFAGEAGPFETSGETTDGGLGGTTEATSFGVTTDDFGEEGFGEVESGESTSGCGFETGDYETGGEGECPPPPPLPPREPHRALIETSVTALAEVTMSEVLTAIALNAEFPTSPSQLHDQLFESYTTAARGTDPSFFHCDDEAPAGSATLGGYPIECPRPEAALRGSLDDWFAIAMVNRFDLAPEDGSHCGEQRIVFANTQLGRALVIFEAQISNPNPSCGVDACRPLAEYWERGEDIDDPIERGERLRAAFITGAPELTDAGFGPFMNAGHLSAGTGQIRTNNFVGPVWTLRQFELVDAGGRLMARPVPVGETPFGRHFDTSQEDPRAESCRAAFLESLPGLLEADPARMGLVMPPECLAAESRDDLDTDYGFFLAQGDGSFSEAIAERIEELRPGSSLRPRDVVERARFAGACMGCHQQSNFASLGEGVVAPASAGFVHVSELDIVACADGTPTACFLRSDALERSFLPHRSAILTEFLAGGGRCEGPTRPLLLSPTAAGSVFPPGRSPDTAKKTLSGRPVGAH